MGPRGSLVTFELSCELDLACDLIGLGGGLEAALLFIVLSI